MFGGLDKSQNRLIDFVQVCINYRTSRLMLCCGACGTGEVSLAAVFPHGLNHFKRNVNICLTGEERDRERERERERDVLRYESAWGKYN